MKKKAIYIMIILLTLVVFFLIVNKKNILLRTNNYKIYNEKNEEVPIYLFSRSSIEYDSGIIKEVLLYIDKKIDMRHQGYNNEVLTLHIDHPMLLETVGGRESFFKMSNFILFQTKANTGDDFWPLYNNRIAYNSEEEEPIKFFIAAGNTYKFNTFGGLKAYGDTIIVEKLDGPIEKEGKYIVSE